MVRVVFPMVIALLLAPPAVAQSVEGEEVIAEAERDASYALCYEGERGTVEKQMACVQTELVALGLLARFSVDPVRGVYAEMLVVRAQLELLRISLDSGGLPAGCPVAPELRKTFAGSRERIDRYDSLRALALRDANEELEALVLSCVGMGF